MPETIKLLRLSMFTQLGILPHYVYMCFTAYQCIFVRGFKSTVMRTSTSPLGGPGLNCGNDSIVAVSRRSAKTCGFSPGASVSLHRGIRINMVRKVKKIVLDINSLLGSTTKLILDVLSHKKCQYNI